MSDTSSVRIGNNSDYKDSASIYNEVSFIYFNIFKKRIKFKRFKIKKNRPLNSYNNCKRKASMTKSKKFYLTIQNVTFSKVRNQYRNRFKTKI